MEPTPLRKLKARMIMKDLSLRELSKLSGVPYSSASQVLSGRLVHPDYLERIEKAVSAAPDPNGKL